jgi:hypothetical protein
MSIVQDPRKKRAKVDTFAPLVENIPASLKAGMDSATTA